MNQMTEHKLTKRQRERALREAREGEAACRHALKVEPCGAYERSLAHWQRVITRLTLEERQ
jgi:hypothetical protein